MATTHSPSELWVHLTKHGGTTARRTLTFIHNPFHCLSSCWYSSRKHVWFGFLTTNVPLTLKKWSGTIWPHVYCYNVQHRGLFALSFLLSPLGSTCCMIYCFSLKVLSVRWRYFSGLSCRYRAGHAGNVGWFIWLVLEKGFAPYVGLMPKSALFFQILLTQRTSDLHLKWKLVTCTYMTSLAAYIKYLYVHTGVQQGSCITGS